MYGFTWKRELLAGSCGSGDQHEANERISQLTRRPHTGTMVAEARGENGSRRVVRARDRARRELGEETAAAENGGRAHL